MPKSNLATYLDLLGPGVYGYTPSPEGDAHRSVLGDRFEAYRERWPLRLCIGIRHDSYGSDFTVAKAGEIGAKPFLVPLAVLPSNILYGTRFGIGDRGLGMQGCYRPVCESFLARVGGDVTHLTDLRDRPDMQGVSPGYEERISFYRFLADRFVWWYYREWIISTPWGEFKDYATMVSSCPFPTTPSRTACAPDAEDRVHMTLKPGRDWVQCHRCAGNWWPDDRPDWGAVTTTAVSAHAGEAVRIGGNAGDGMCGEGGGGDR